MNHTGCCRRTEYCYTFHLFYYILSEAWSGVNWADLMAAQGAFGTDFYDTDRVYTVKSDAYCDTTTGCPVKVRFVFCRIREKVSKP